MLFSCAKRTRQNSDFEKYKQIQNRVVSQLCEAKSRFFKTINPRNAKKFWKAVKHLNKTRSSIPVLSDAWQHKYSFWHGDKAEMLCDFFSKCFNHAVPPLSTGNSTLNTGHTIPEELLCTEDEVHFFLTSLATSKATGPVADLEFWKGGFQ